MYTTIKSFNESLKRNSVKESIGLETYTIFCGGSSRSTDLLDNIDIHHIQASSQEDALVKYFIQEDNQTEKEALSNLRHYDYVEHSDNIKEWASDDPFFVVGKGNLDIEDIEQYF